MEDKNKKVEEPKVTPTPLEKTETAAIDEDKLVKAAMDILNQALVEVEKLEKSDGDSTNEDENGGAVSEVADPSKGKTMEKDGEIAPQGDAPVVGDKKEDEDDEEKKKEMSEEETLQRSYNDLVGKMLAKGMKLPVVEGKKEEVVAKSEEPKAEVKPAVNTDVADLRKSIDEKFDAFQKQISAVAERLEKIASTPATTRKGVSGVAPLKKSEENDGEPLTKSAVIEKLLDLKKNRDPRVDTLLITKVETGTCSAGDIKRIKSILG